MLDQAAMRDKLNNFLERRGLLAKFLAEKIGLSESSMYCFKNGYRFLSQKQLQDLDNYITVYDARLDGTSNDTNEGSTER